MISKSGCISKSPPDILKTLNSWPLSLKNSNSLVKLEFVHFKHSLVDSNAQPWLKATSRNWLKQLIHLVGISYKTDVIFKIRQRNDLLEWSPYTNWDKGICHAFLQRRIKYQYPKEKKNLRKESLKMQGICCFLFFNIVF